MIHLIPTIIYRFWYNNLGRGDLVLVVNGDEVMKFPSRTGSIDHNGKLINALPVKRYYCIKPSEMPVGVEYDKMYVKGKEGSGFKIRLFTELSEKAWTHFLIHPDGSYLNLHDGNGTLGCIGTMDNAPGFRLYHDNLLENNKNHGVFVELGLA